MFNVVLFEPEIPPNTGNIIRLSANCGFRLHLIHPLGFSLEERALRRAGLDYHECARIIEHSGCEAYLKQEKPERLFACTTKAAVPYSDFQYRAEDSFLFGPESRGLPATIRNHPEVTHAIRIPMLENSRSLNLANSVSVIVYEAWRQNRFATS